MKRWIALGSIMIGVVLVLIIFFFVTLGFALAHAHRRFGPSLELLEMYGPP